MSATIYLLTICLPLATILLVFGMRSYATVQQAKLRLSHEESYRQIATQATASQTELAAMLASIDASLADVKTRISAIEKILKEVE